MPDKRWIAAMPIEIAFLCANCDTVGNSPESCPVCGSTQLLPLARILNRPAPPANGGEGGADA